jgi:hypothetical protein
MNNTISTKPLHMQLARDLKEEEINKVSGGRNEGGVFIVPDGGLGTIDVTDFGIETDCL